MSATKRLCAAALALLLTVLAAPPSASAAPPVFTHPGVLVSRPQLDFIRTQVNANAQPWRNAYNQMAGSQYASLSSWPNATRFATMLRGVYLPEIVNGAATMNGNELGTAPPGNLCGGSVQRGLGPVTEVGYNHLHTRLGITMPNTQTLTESRRPAGTNNMFVAWQTLTHANNPH